MRTRPQFPVTDDLGQAYKAWIDIDQAMLDVQNTRQIRFVTDANGDRWRVYFTATFERADPIERMSSGTDRDIDVGE